MQDAKVHIYYGNGKGKTTAATGLALRMIGSGKKVTFCQFLKDGASSEIKALKYFKDNCNVMFYGEALKFIQLMDDKELEACKMIENQLFVTACKTKGDLLVLDEVLDLIDYGILDEQLLLFYLDNRGDTEVVLTGRNPSEKLKKRADYITEMRCEKHPYYSGYPAREGVEF
jgi:cob(I)alamin adenosyltransferase